MKVNCIFRVVKKNRKLSLLSNGEFFSRFLCEKCNSKNLVGMVFCIGSTWAGSVGGSNLWITNVTYYLIYTFMIAFTVFWVVYAKTWKIMNRLLEISRKIKGHHMNYMNYLWMKPYQTKQKFENGFKIVGMAVERPY